jgi:uncharacterized damage-inducible protein DinB
MPEDKLTWKPHEKSRTAGQLALHIAALPGRIATMLREDAPAPQGLGKPTAQPATRQEVLSTLEQSAATFRETLPTFTDERMHAIWRLMAEGKELLAMPRMIALRRMLLNHWYHHRGQFGVYLRLMGALVPSSYGPSGDEMPGLARS